MQPRGLTDRPMQQESGAAHNYPGRPMQQESGASHNYPGRPMQQESGASHAAGVRRGPQPHRAPFEAEGYRLDEAGYRLDEEGHRLRLDESMIYGASLSRPPRSTPATTSTEAPAVDDPRRSGGGSSIVPGIMRDPPHRLGPGRPPGILGSASDQHQATTDRHQAPDQQPRFTGPVTFDGITYPPEAAVLEQVESAVAEDRRLRYGVAGGQEAEAVAGGQAPAVWSGILGTR